MISEDFAFFGFDEVSWDRLVSLFLGERATGRPRGVLVVLVDGDRVPIASFHTLAGSVDPATLPSLSDLEAVCAATAAGACIVTRERAIADLERYLAEPLDPTQDFATRVMRFAHVVRELGNGNWLRIWPNPVPDLLLAAAPATKSALDYLLPDGRSAVLGVFDEGELWTGAVLRRRAGSVDVFAGPGAIAQWAGPLGGAWRRDQRVLTRAVERELGSVHIGLFLELATARALFAGERAGDWAIAYASRALIVQPLPAYAAAGLGIDVLSGVTQYAMQALEQMEPEELVAIAQGFWRGLTDGRGVEGLLGFSPVRALVGAVQKARSEEPPAEVGKDDNDAPSDPRQDPSGPSNGASRSKPLS